MKNRNTGKYSITRRIKHVAFISALGMAFMIALPHIAHAQVVTPPPVPGTLNPPDGSVAFLIGHAFGTQDYVCAPSATGGVAFVLTTPEAVLFDNPARRIINHFFSANPFESGMVRATWQSTRDASAFWGKLSASATFASNPEFVAKDAIAWLGLSRAGVVGGLEGGGILSTTTFVQRVNTVGGLAPTVGCSSPDDLGNTAFVPYQADYVFFNNPTATTAASARQ